MCKRFLETNIYAGGTNPALRTLYYRLTRLLQLNITPLFVFDGRSRPAFKRNHKTHSHLTPALSKNTKALLKLFGFPYHDAPGEAEAECAVLQQNGVVDAVMSEDVDTLMFGCGTTFRNWSGQGSKQTPTHVTVYEREDVERESGLTRNGMILVALMSGGDYLPEGVPRCGIKIAADCARAGFGEDLCNLVEDDEEGFKEWRERLQFELDTNESGWFRRKNKSVVIPPNFPDRTVLGYYTNPVVSNQDAVEKLRRKIKWDGQVDLFRLRESVRHAFEWRGKQGAAKFVRTLAPALVSRRLLDGNEKGALENIVKGFHGKREHCSTDGLKELRLSFIPGEVIIIDMVAEEEDEVEEDSSHEEEEEGAEEGTRKPKDYDIFAPERIWVVDMYARMSLHEMITEWEQPKSKVRGKKMTAKANVAEGSKLGCSNVSKPSNLSAIVPAKKPRGRSRAVGMGSEITIWNDRPTVTTGASLDSMATSEESCEVVEPEVPAVRLPTARKSSRTTVTDGAPAPKKKVAKPKDTILKPPKKSTRYQPEESVQEPDEEPPTPWRTARRPSITFGVSPPCGRRFSALGIYGESLPESFGNATCPPIDSPYELPEALAPSPAQSPSPSLPPVLSYLEHETIMILSSPAPAALSPCRSPPTTPSRGRKSSVLEPSQPNTPSHDYSPSREVRAPSLTRKSPRALTSAFKRLQVVDLLEDTPSGPVGHENGVDKVSDFSPTFTPLSPNVTIRKNRKGRKIREPQPGLQSNDVSNYSAPIPFPLFARSASLPQKVASKSRGEVTDGKTKKRVVLRESLEGRWEFIEDTWGVREGTKIWEELEVLDLTGDD